jgi:hypothetical protein
LGKIEHLQKAIIRIPKNGEQRNQGHDNGEHADGDVNGFSEFFHGGSVGYLGERII